VTANAPASHPLADLYVARALDPVIELAREVAGDFVIRPQHHTRASAEEAALLANFRLLVGKHPEWPNAVQRSFASSKLFARMCQSFADIRLAALRYVQSASESGLPFARRAFVESAELVRATVQPLEGGALSAVADTHLTMVRRAVTAIGSGRVAAAFGIADWRVDKWPEDAFSPRFGYLCESISQTLADARPLRQPDLSSLQRAARHGAATIAGVCAGSFDDSDDDRFVSVVHAAAAWAAALGEILSRLDVPRSWQDPAYRSTLLPLHRDMMPPHPSGEVDVEGTVRTAAARFSASGGGLGGSSTQTVAGEICCCTGDLVCPVNTNGQCDISDDCPTLTSVLIA
jgi:mersacidin/lichenicidin family type 2 lantibiotic